MEEKSTGDNLHKTLDPELLPLQLKGPFIRSSLPIPTSYNFQATVGSQTFNSKCEFPKQT